MSIHRIPHWPMIGLSLALAAPVAAEEPKAAAPSDAASEAEQRARPAIVISGDDADLVDAVAAELRAAGFDVIVVAPDPKPTEHATIVNIERIGDSVVVHAVRSDGELDAELLETEDGDGMTDRDATALRAAEAIRSLVTTPKKKPGPPPPAAPETPAPAAVPTVPAVVPATVNVGADGVTEPAEIRQMPVFRMALFSGGGIVARDPSLVVGLSLRGQLSRYMNIAGLVMATKNVDDDGHEGSMFDIYGARAALLTSWEILGADNVWTPSLGGGVIGDFRYWNGIGGFGHDETVLTYYTPVYEGGSGGVGLAATAGISVAKPWRFRFDVHADVRMVTWELFGDGHDQVASDLAPSVVGTFGIEYDFITKPVLAAAPPSSPRTTAGR